MSPKPKKPNPGSNRQQRRAQERNPYPRKSEKPTWLRVLIIAVLAIMILGFFILPLLH